MILNIDGILEQTGQYFSECVFSSQPNDKKLNVLTIKTYANIFILKKVPF